MFRNILNVRNFFVIQTRYDSSESSLILLNLIIAMAAAQVVFMGGIQATSSQVRLIYIIQVVLTFLILLH